MEVRPRTEVKETSPIKLGKKGMEEDQSEQDTEAEKKGGKRGKFQEETLKIEAAGVQEHSCRAQ